MKTELEIQTYSYINYEFRPSSYSMNHWKAINTNRYKLEYTGTINLVVNDYIKFIDGPLKDVVFKVVTKTSTYIIVDREIIELPKLYTDSMGVVFEHLGATGPDVINPMTNFPIICNVGDKIHIDGTSFNNGTYSIIGKEIHYVTVAETVTDEHSGPSTTWWVGDSNILEGDWNYAIGYLQNVIHQNFERLDLFDDESISLTLKQIDTTDIGKNYADYTQTFNVPASAKNNILLSHYYDVDNDYQLNANFKIPSRLLIDSIPFRNGKLQLEKVNLTNGKPDTYSLTFYTNLVKLKDLFGDDLISNLDINIDGSELTNDIEFNYTDNEFFNAIKGATATNKDIIVPLISTTREWTFGDTGTNDIKFDGGPLGKMITKSELLPSLKLLKIFNLIKEKYSIQFSDDFFSNKTIFNDLYLWCNKSSTITTLPSIQNVFNAFIPVFPNNDSTSTITIEDNSIINLDFSQRFTRLIRFYVFVNTTDYGKEFEIALLDENNNVLVKKTGVTDSFFNNFILDIPESIEFGLGFKKKVKISIAFTNQTVVYNTNISLSYYLNTTTGSANRWTSSASSQTAKLLSMNTIKALPNMKVYDFMVSLFKMFNLIILPDSFIENSFIVKTLNDFIDNGNELDITEEINKDKVVINRQKIYKSLKFSHEKNDMKYNYDYLLTNGREFGSENLLNIKGGSEDYVVESKFQIVRSIKLSDFPIARGTDKDLKFLENKPTLMMYGGHLEGLTSRTFGFNLNGTSTEIQYYPYMGTDNSYYNYRVNRNVLLLFNYSQSYSINITPTGTTSVGFAYFGEFEDWGQNFSILLTDDGNYYELLTSTIVNISGTNYVKYSINALNSDWFIIPNILTYTYIARNFSMYRKNRNYWRAKSYIQSISFSNEFGFDGGDRSITLFESYYKEYIDLLYDTKTRVFEYECYLPVHILQKLDLSTTLKIGDKRFSIVDIQVNLLDGKSSMKLVNYLNFRNGSVSGLRDRTDILNVLYNYNVISKPDSLTFFNYKGYFFNLDVRYGSTVTAIFNCTENTFTTRDFSEIFVNNNNYIYKFETFTPGSYYLNVVKDGKIIIKKRYTTYSSLGSNYIEIDEALDSTVSKDNMRESIVFLSDI